MYPGVILIYIESIQNIFELFKIIFLFKVIIKSKEKMAKRKKKLNECERFGFDCVGRATERCLFTGAIRLLPNTETFACCVSALGRFVPP